MKMTTDQQMAAPQQKECQIWQNDESDDLCFTIDDVVFLAFIWFEFVLFYFQYITIGIILVIKNYIVNDDKFIKLENKKRSLRNKVNSTKATRGYGTMKLKGKG
jgi:hypothetical protein